MKRFLLLQIVALAALLPLTGFLAVRAARHFREARLSLGGRDFARLKPETAGLLARLKGRVTLTYFVSAREKLPSAMVDIEPAVRSLLEAMKRAAPEHVDVRVIDPEVDPKIGPNYAAGKRASPVNVRKVLQDESAQEGIWSSLAIAQDRCRDTLIQGITPLDLPYLEDLIAEHLKTGTAPIRPAIAVAAPEQGYRQLLGEIANLSGAQVLQRDFNRQPRIPWDADLFIWIDPAGAGEEHRDELKRFLDSGRSAILAGSAALLEPRPGAAPGSLLFQPRQSACDWKALLRPWGLDLEPLILLDKQQEAISWRRGDGSALKVEAPFQIRIPASLWDVRSLLGPSLGALLLRAVNPLRQDHALLARAGLEAETVATTSEFTRIFEPPAAEFGAAAFEAAEPAPKQPWLVLIKPRDPWKGQLLVSGTSSLFHDDLLGQSGNADQAFLRTLLRTFTEPGRLARIRVPRPGPERIPALSRAARLAWRGIVVFLAPLFLAALALLKARALQLGPRRAAVVKTLAAGGLGFLLLITALQMLRPWRGPYLDCTEDALNTPSPLTRRLLDRHREDLLAELAISEGSRMPASLKRLEPRLLSALRWLGIRARLLRPEELPPAEQESLRNSGIAPFEENRVEDDDAVPVKVWSGLRLRWKDKTEVIPRIDSRSIEHLEFLLTAAVKRLESGRAPLAGVLSDLPRLSPAEAHSDYQQKGTIAPVGSDVYSFAKNLLSRYGYRVAYINPEAPVFPAGMDLLIWLQPRYPWKFYPQFADYLAAGGKAIIALQHYNIQQRQYRGTGFTTVYWPQPQFHSFNDYLQHLGIRQVGEKSGDQPGEILFDRNHGHLRLETQVNRSAFRESDPQEVSRPFLIRVMGEGLSPDSTITSRLGELLFIWGSRFQVEEEKLRKLGLTASVLASTSHQTWTYAWSGGWIPEASFEPPAAPPGGRKPLAVLIEGPFPELVVKKEDGGRATIQPPERPGDPSRLGKLLLIGCSEMFKNAHLHAPDYQHDQFLLNAAAFLAHGPEVAEIQARQRAPRSFPVPPAGVKTALRIVAIGLAPALFLVFGCTYSLWRRRPVLRRNR
ncbi:MAG: Gldg family protein [Planctomycetes bacterium]|nr:Gldg family protein [Planctomycetota bacterium]